MRVVVFCCYILLMIMAGTVSGGCMRHQREPLYINPTLFISEKQPDSIAVLPIVDLRSDRSVIIDLDKEIRVPISSVLRNKGYFVSMPNSFSDNKVISPLNLNTMDASELSALGPKDCSAILITCLEEAILKEPVIDPTATYNSCTIAASVTLVDKQNRSVLWKDKGVGFQEEAGFLAPEMQEATGTKKKVAIDNWLKQVFSTLPDRSKK